MSKEQKRQAFYTQSPEEVLKAVDATEQGCHQVRRKSALPNLATMNSKKARNDQYWLNLSSNLRI